MRRRSLKAVLLAAAGAAIVPATPSSGAVRAKPSRPAQAVTLYVLPASAGIPGPDGETHAAFVPANFAVRAGRQVKVTMINYETYDDGVHTLVATGLRLEVQIKSAVKRSGGQVLPATTTFSFTPARKGVYRWHCEGPTDDMMGMAGGSSWEMGQGYGGPGKEGFMAGFVVVI